jgi:serpin B
MMYAFPRRKKMRSIIEKKVLPVCWFFIILVFMSPCATAQPKSASAAGNAFALDLYDRLSEKDGNLFFSPASIQTALAMAYAGAEERTATQMARVLHFEKSGQAVHAEFKALLQQLNTPRMVRYYKEVDGEIKPAEKPAYELVMANALWGQQGYPWFQAFLELAASNYGAGLREVDFAREPEAARRTINRWVENKTQDRIRDLIARGAIRPLMRLILTNAIYFKAAWAQKFSDHATRDMPFHISGSCRIPVSMMARKDDFRYLETESFQALEMAYEANQLSMVVFLPTAVDGLEDFENSLTLKKLEAWMKAFRREEVDVFFPKFTFTSSFGLSGILSAMGMQDAFSPDSADFSGMTAAEKIFISDVIHKAFVAVDEEGTTAAAATAVMMAGTAMPMPKPDPKVFRADHPFLFCIRHNPTGKILFMGRLSAPDAK